MSKAMDNKINNNKGRKRSSSSIDTINVDNSNVNDTINNDNVNDTININNDNDRYEIVRLMNDYVTTGHEDKFYDLYNAISNNNDTVNTIKNKVTNNKTNDNIIDKPDIATMFADEIEGIRKHPSFNNSNQLAYLKEIVMIED